jgi:hypothetical protein
MSLDQASNRAIVRQWATFIAIIATFGVNTWSNLAPPQGQTIGDISNTLFQGVLIVPANYAFAIWGLIYLGLFAYGIYQLRPSQRLNSTLATIDYALIVACVAQTIWIFLFLYGLFWASVVAMLAILIPLAVSYRQIWTELRPSRQEKWFVQVPFSIYLGWISVATVVNVAIALYDSNWGGWGLTDPVWTLVMMVVSAVLAVAAALLHRDAAFTFVIIWALVAIAVAQRGAGLGITIWGILLAMALFFIVEGAILLNILFSRRNQTN